MLNAQQVKLMKKFEQLLKIRFTENNDFVMRKKRT